MTNIEMIEKLTEENKKLYKVWDKVIKEIGKELDNEVLKKTITQINEAYSYGRRDGIIDCLGIIKKHIGEEEVLEIIDKYKGEMEK